MVQKSYKLEVLLDILKNRENHARAIAKNLKASHTNILRKVNELLKENVLDYRQEGKNKILFLKKTLKARNYVCLAEFYKLNKLLEQYPEMNIILKEVIQANAKLIVLFGSYAKFIAKRDSDIDLFIETRDKKLKEKMKLINNKINLKIGSFDLDNKLIKEIIKNHIILRGVEEFYERTKFFK